jgi:serine protein kinase
MAAFKNNRNNEAFLDRIYIVKVPYCLRVSDEVHIYEKLLTNSVRCRRRPARRTPAHDGAVSVLSRLKEPENSSIFSKMRVYDGENLKDTDPKAKSYQEYRDFAGVDEGMTGLSTRFAFKILSKVFNFDHREVAANPVHLMYVLEQQIEQEQFRPRSRRSTCATSRNTLAALRRIHRQGNPDGLPRKLFRIRPEHLRPLCHLRRLLDPGSGIPRPNTGEMLDRNALNDELEKIEKPAGISNPKDFRNEVVNFVLRARAKNDGKNPAGQLREAARGDREEDVLEHRGPAAGDFLQCQGQRRRPEEAPGLRQSHDRQGLHREAGPLLCEWYLRVRKSS